jgi:hypothetical protein
MILHIATSSLLAQPISDVYRVLMISNLDDMPENDLRIVFLKEHMDQITSPFALIINGDFSQDPTMKHIKDLASYISGRVECRMIILQGDRDWANSRSNGWEKVVGIEKEIKRLAYPNVLWMNEKGCPGPEIITLDNHVQFIGINTQWFNHPYAKPTGESGECSIAESSEFIEELEDLLDDHSDQNILMAGHFPFRSNGAYGGRYPVSDWLFPVPIVSGFMTSYKQNVGGPKEIVNQFYKVFAEDMLDVILARNSIIYASGHDRHTEILRHGNNYLINAGGLAKTTSVKHSRFTLEKETEPGFIELTYIPDGSVQSQFLKYDNKAGYQKSNEYLLFQAPCENPVRDIPVNERFIPCSQELPVLDEMILKHPDSVTLAVNADYNAGRMRKLFLGQHYRSSWVAPITVPVLKLDDLFGGLEPFSIGGGRQTKSLKFRSNSGYEYVFRSLDKDPTKSLQYDLRNTVIDIILQDQTTTQYPFGALAAPVFLEQLGILHASPQMYIMPDDPKLGPWRKEYGGLLGMLEERPTDSSEKIFAGADDIKRSIKLFRKLYKDRDNRIVTDEFMKARMLDIYLGDWGRHEDNWKWAGYDDKKNTLYRPIPRDRDHMFSKWDGFLPWLADREWAKASGENFDDDIKDIRSLTWQNRHMDRFLLSEADRSDWIRAAQAVAAVASPSTIEKAMNQMPHSSATLDKSEIEKKLVVRSAKLEDFASQYYDLLAKEVDVVGSNKHELFEVNRNDDGSVRVEMYKLKDGEKDEKYYDRLFLPDETKEVRLFGMSGMDKFRIQGETDKSIKLRIIPGMDQDSIVDESIVKGCRSTKLYISEYDEDFVDLGVEGKLEKHAAPDAYDYDRTAFHYNTYFPLLYMFYNSDRGLDIGGQVTFTNYKYGKEKFSSKHGISARLSTNGNLSVKYAPRWNDVFGKWDIVGKLEYEKNKNFNFYFGKGFFNEYDKDLLLDRYYTLRYSTAGVGLGLSCEFWELAEVSAIFTGFYNSDQRRANTIADDIPNIRGIESRFNTQLEITADLDLRDRNDLPHSGYRFYLASKIGTDIKSEAGSFLSGSSHIELFNTFHPVTLGLRFGGSVNEGDVPYFLLQYLGRNTFLRGFRQNRFFGDKALFANSEVRVQLINTKKAILPYQFGLKFFADAGKIIIDDEELEDSEWKFGYGAGFYLVPYKERLTLNLTLGFSEEESLLVQFKFGKPF